MKLGANARLIWLPMIGGNKRSGRSGRDRLQNFAVKASGGMLALVFAAQLGACSSDKSTVPLGSTASSSSLETKYDRDGYGVKKLEGMPYGSSFAGAVVADEPTAALVARDVLENGGNAADAATALYFALSVTYPGAASLGGGGICLARDAKSGDVSSIAFPASASVGGGSIGIPGNVRGFALIQARYGNAKWSSLVSPAERMAATGFRVSRATSGQLSANALTIGSAPDLNQTFTRADGLTYQEGDVQAQRKLAAVLGAIRARGIAGFYQGDVARTLVANAGEKGGMLTASDLSNFRPTVEPAQSIPFNELNIWLPASNTDAGKFAGELWTKIQGVSGAGALTDAANQVAGISGNDDVDYGSTSFVTVDGEGGAVACALSMNGAFGTGRVGSDNGVVFSATSQSAVKGRASSYLTPAIVARAKSKDGLYGVVAGAGAPKGGAAVESIIAAALTGNPEAAIAALNASPADARSPANAILCLEGLPKGSCSLHATSKGDGVGFGAVTKGN